MSDNSIIKVLAVVFVALYVISPIDACPGPVDDVLLVLLTCLANRKQITG